MDTKHLKRRYNVYWVRVWVPEPVREILGKSELWKNLYTTDLAEANTKKHRVVAELMGYVSLYLYTIYLDFVVLGIVDVYHYQILPQPLHSPNQTL